MKKYLFWPIFATFCAVLGAVQLAWPPSRFGGVFFAALALCCLAEWLLLRGRDACKACAVLAGIGRVLFGLFVVSFVWVQLAVIAPGTHMDDMSRHEMQNVEYFLVLGALVNPDGQPSAALAARCDTAAALLAENPHSRAILCGGQGANEPKPEADAMFDYLTARGVSADRLLKEDQSTNTIQNIRNARAFLAPGDLAATVTNDYHVARVRVLMKSAGLVPLAVPAPTPYPAQWISVRCREYCSIVGLMLTGRWK